MANNKDNAAVAQMPNAESIIKSRYEGLRLFFENVSEGKFELECCKVRKAIQFANNIPMINPDLRTAGTTICL